VDDMIMLTIIVRNHIATALCDFLCCC